MAEKRSIAHTSSCSHCYQKKLKCDLGNPCHHCVRNQVECIPVEVTSRPHKKRFPEAELMTKIKRYETALQSYGAELEAINKGESTNDVSPQSTRVVNTSPGPSTISVEQATTDQLDDLPSHHNQDDLHTLLNIIDGEQLKSNDGTRVDKVFFERFFKDDGSSLLFAMDSSGIPNHPAPFEIFRLWQIYCDNVQPLCKIIHIPTFQRKISTYGTRLHQAPAADQALFFAMYLAAISTLDPDECQKSFNSSKEALQKQYQSAVQLWLRRAGFWKTSKLSVLQSFVLFLYTQQNVVVPRALATYTGMAERIARRIGLHQDGEIKEITFVDEEMRKRLWWELIFLDARTLEKAGMGNLSVTGDWTRSLPSAHSDSNLEDLQGHQSQVCQQPCPEMLFHLIRCETTRLSVDIRKQQNSLTLKQQLDMIDKLKDQIESRYLPYCNYALPHHRLTILNTGIVISRMRISAYLLEEANTEGFHQDEVRINLVKQCNLVLGKFTEMRGNPALKKFQWFMMQYMPIFVYIHLLRLLQTQIKGPYVDQAWSILEDYRSQGVTLPVDSLVLRAWKARQATVGADPLTVPNFVRVILDSSTPSATQREVNTDQSMNSPSDSDYMAMLADIMAGNTDYSFNWSTWLQESPDQTSILG